MHSCSPSPRLLAWLSPPQQSPAARSRWLRDIASRVDPPRILRTVEARRQGPRHAAARRAHEIEITNVRITDRAGRAYRAAGGGPGRPNRVKGLRQRHWRLRQSAGRLSDSSHPHPAQNLSHRPHRPSRLDRRRGPTIVRRGDNEPGRGHNDWNDRHQAAATHAAD